VLAIAVHSLRFLYSPCISLLATSAVWLYGSKIGKLKLREKLVNRISWRSDEQVLDAGCGSGLLLIAAAKRLTTGRATGADIWRSEDLANNSRETTLRNAEAEGVQDKITLDDANICSLPYAGQSFDAILSLNVIHNIDKREDRATALRELARVRKPGGTMVLCDFRNVQEYTSELQSQGITGVRKEFIGWVGFFPMYAAVVQSER
jgi:arsenite methyltransferase